MAQKTLYGVSDTRRLSVQEYAIEKETAARYYLKNSVTRFVDKDKMSAYYGESFFLTAREAVQFVVDTANKRILEAQQVIERETAVVKKYQALLDGIEPDEEG